MSSVRRTRATSKCTVAETASALIKKRKLEGKPTGEASEPLEVSEGESELAETEPSSKRILVGFLSDARACVQRQIGK